MYKYYKFRMHPTEKILNKGFRCCRFIFNYYLNDTKENRLKFAYTCIKDYLIKLKYKKNFLQEVDSTILKKIIIFIWRYTKNIL